MKDTLSLLKLTVSQFSTALERKQRSGHMIVMHQLAQRDSTQPDSRIK
jgi:hypothetical protein